MSEIILCEDSEITAETAVVKEFGSQGLRNFITLGGRRLVVAPCCQRQQFRGLSRANIFPFDT